MKFFVFNKTQFSIFIPTVHLACCSDSQKDKLSSPILLKKGNKIYGGPPDMNRCHSFALDWTVSFYFNREFWYGNIYLLQLSSFLLIANDIRFGFQFILFRFALRFYCAGFTSMSFMWWLKCKIHLCGNSACRNDPLGKEVDSRISRWLPQSLIFGPTSSRFCGPYGWLMETGGLSAPLSFSSPLLLLKEGLPRNCLTRTPPGEWAVL